MWLVGRVSCTLMREGRCDIMPCWPCHALPCAARSAVPFSSGADVSKLSNANHVAGRAVCKNMGADFGDAQRPQDNFVITVIKRS